MNNKCIYYVEGPCEQQLIAALKESPFRRIQQFPEKYVQMSLLDNFGV